MRTSADELREEVRRRYAEAARSATEGDGNACCGGEKDGGDVFGASLYGASERD